MHPTALIVSLCFLLSSTFSISTTTPPISQTSDGQPQAPGPTKPSSTAQEQPTCSPYQAVKLRYPPTINTSLDFAWNPPPPAWIYGNWKITYSSRPSYHQLYNFQHDCYPVLPSNMSVTSGLQVDLTSWNLPPSNNATLNHAIFTAFGYDTPLAVAAYVFRFNGTGILSTTSNEWEVTAWGYDSDSVGYRVEFETEAPGAGGPCINVLSREETGPTRETVEGILTGMREVYANDEGLLGLVANVTRMHVDGRRTGSAPVSCGVGCMANVDLEA